MEKNKFSIFIFDHFVPFFVLHQPKSQKVFASIALSVMQHKNKHKRKQQCTKWSTIIKIIKIIYFKVDFHKLIGVLFQKFLIINFILICFINSGLRVCTDQNFQAWAQPSYMSARHRIQNNNILREIHSNEDPLEKNNVV